MDTRRIKENHQQGIDRIKQRRNNKNEYPYSGNRGYEHADWFRKDGSLTPRRG